MSEEERIKDIIEILELSKEEIENNNENITATLDLQDLKSLKNLLELYNKGKEKNKELQNADLTTVYLNGFYDGEKKWKDKIKEKLQRYYDKVHLADKNSLLDMYNQAVLNGKIQGLEDLLEEDNK